MSQYTQYSGYDDYHYTGEHPTQPSQFGVQARPVVDPEAEGEVDLNL